MTMLTSENIRITIATLKEYAGEKCDDYAEGCPTCQTWTLIEGLELELTEITARS